MKTLCVIFAITCVFGLVRADPFRNLGFDEALTNRVYSTNPGSGGWGPASDLLPGWQLYHGGVLQTNVGLDLTGFDNDFASLTDNFNPFSFNPFIEGSYAMEFVGTSGNTVPFELVQRGDIPYATTLLKLRYQQFPFSPTINGVPILPLSPLLMPSTDIGEAVFPIAAFAGQNVELRLITATPCCATPDNDVHYLDSIQFVTEPPALAINRVGTDIVISWPAPSPGFVLQSTDVFRSTNRWQTVPATPVITGNEQSVTTNLNGQTTFYRLTRMKKFISPTGG